MASPGAGGGYGGASARPNADRREAASPGRGVSTAGFARQRRLDEGKGGAVIGRPRHLVGIAYPDQGRASEVLDMLLSLRDDDLIDREHAVYVTKAPDGRVRLHQSVSTAGAGAMRGGLTGLAIGMIGMLLLMLLAGVAVGAAGGALGGWLSDLGIAHLFIRRLSEQLQPGSSALFVIVGRAVRGKVLPALSRYGGTVLDTTWPDGAEARLQAALDAGAARPGTADASPPTGAPGAHRE
jgi:uncharacterized membrane protein